MSEPAGLDVRLPIGAFFLLLGVLLVAYALLGPAGTAAAATAAEAGHATARHYRVDLWWGVVLLIFGGFMLSLALRHRRRERVARETVQ